MENGDFSQLPVFDEKRKQWLGLVTDYTLLKRTASPSTKTEENWLEELKKMRIRDAEVLDPVPIYPITASVSEIAQALTFHYAVLIDEAKQEDIVDSRRKVEHNNVGIVTRADYLKLLLQSNEEQQ